MLFRVTNKKGEIDSALKTILGATLFIIILVISTFLLLDYFRKPVEAASDDSSGLTTKFSCTLARLGDRVADADNDGFPDDCDICPFVMNGKNRGDFADTDRDGLPDNCDENVETPEKQRKKIDPETECKNKCWGESLRQGKGQCVIDKSSECNFA
ncbi:hypothetical protein COV16_03215 [Candidatus Woesearchaeota archaeon CG10_big_fil_rev_8_21_14_0_10_34_8]|nr:MAG: hypothetical protein COV16_03215 [Candidatus Woesearchaeota archaeon CG10_big_fil_rev_8_21_14_0_10_34_8]